MSEQGYCRAFVLLAEACAEKFGAPLPKHLLEIGDPNNGWGAKLNPTNGDLDGIGPFEAHVTWGGFPAGSFNAFGGIIAAGSAANEDTFIAWLETQIPATKESP